MPPEASGFRTRPPGSWRTASRRAEPRRGDYIVRFLARSKRFAGIGQATAHKLWQAHGERLYAILAEADPSPLDGILGLEQAIDLLQAWQEDQAESDVAVWLDENRFDTRLANKIIRVWGTEGAGKLRANPYVMLTFAGWQSVDDAARRIGITGSDHRRLIGAVEGALYMRLDQKHTAIGRALLETMVAGMLHADNALATQAVELAMADGGAISTPSAHLLQPAGAAVMERYVEDRIRRMVSSDLQSDIFLRPLDKGQISEAIAAIDQGPSFELTDQQQSAVEMAVNRSFGLLLGGAGVGKTTVLRIIHDVSERHGRRIIQMALSGRAAQRMRQASDRKAYTIAGFLMQVAGDKIQIGSGDLIIVDEASMLDLPLAYRILRAMPENARLLLVGDPAQLPPIGFGLVFHVAAASPNLPRVELTRIHRQAKSTGIPAVALEVRNGRLPRLPQFDGNPSPGLSIFPCRPGQLTTRLVDILAALGGPDECQILSPLRLGQTGAEAINAYFHAICSPGRRLLPKRSIAVGEPVLWTRNDWQLGLMNGSLGRVMDVTDEGSVEVDFEGDYHVFNDPDALDPMQLAYAITVHKAQGSQFPRVVVPVFPSRLMDRTLIYTAITRATDQVVLVGDIAAAIAAVAAPPKPDQRVTGLTI